ncbi:MAG: HAD-IA family hydrolase [Pseudomonadota bacterium]
MNIKALIFDFGGVITRTLFETHDLTERALGLPSGTLTWRGPFAPETDPVWQSMQEGEISERDYWMRRTKEVGALVGKDWTGMSDFVKAARGADPDAIIRPEFLETIDIAKRNGVRLAILSNELDLFYGKELRSRLSFLADFDVISDATYTEILKPDPRAYQDCLSKLKLEAQDCVFIDDQKRNIEGAKAIGLSFVHFDVQNPKAGFQAALELADIKEMQQ